MSTRIPKTPAPWLWGPAVIAATVAFAGITSGATAGADGKPDRCARKGSYTLKQTAKVRVYARERPIFYSFIYACHRPTGQATLLGNNNPGGLFQWGGRRATAIRGSLIAFGSLVDPSQSEGLTQGVIRVVKLPTRHPSSDSRPEIVYARDANTDGFAIEKLLIAPNRSLAFASCVYFNGEPDRCDRPLKLNRVLIVPYERTTRTYRESVVLDQGPDIDPRSLRLSPNGRRIAWTKAGRTRTAPTP